MPPLVDNRFAWTPRALLELAHIWRRIELAHPALGRVDKVQRVYDAFSEHCSIPRSRKAVEDKLYAMKQMYRFIVEVDRNAQRSRSDNTNTHARSWFELTKEERRALQSRHNVRIPSMSHELYLVFDSVLRREILNTEPPASVSTAASTTLRAALGSLHRTALLECPSGDEDSHCGNDAALSSSNRNWTAFDTAALATAWASIQQAQPHLSDVALSEQVHRALATHSGSRLPSRSLKAVEEKMRSMKKMYAFIQRHDDRARAAVAGNSSSSRDAQTWFDLSTLERRRLRKTHGVRTTNLSRDEFEQMQAIVRVQTAATAAADALPLAAIATPVATPAAVSAPLLNAAASNDLSQSTVESASLASTLQRVTTQTLRAVAVNEQGCCHCDVLVADASSAVTHDRARKRARVDDHLARVAATAEPTTMSLLLEQIRALHDEDRAERRQQHAELLASLQALTALVQAIQR